MGSRGSTGTSASSPATSEVANAPSPSTTEVPVQTTSAPPPTSAAPTTPPSASAATTPTEGTQPVFVQELVLKPDGIGTRAFGSDPEAAITYVSSLLGSPTDDSDWVEAAEFPSCMGKMVRVVRWGVLALQFSDQSEVRDDGRHLLAWTYGETREIGQSPEGLRTSEGVGVGSSVAELRAVLPGIEVLPGDPDTEFPDSFTVSGRYWGLLTGSGDDGIVTQISSINGCGA